MNNYSKTISTKSTPQTQAVPGKVQVKNAAGGFVFPLETWKRLDRFLILGTEGGTYYSTEADLTVDNAKTILELINSDGLRVVNQVVTISTEGRAPKNDAAIFTLALCTAFGNAETKQAAYAAITKVCRTGTHLFTFCQDVQNLRGWSRGLRTGVGKFYLKNADKVAYQVVKYRQRNGWTHRDVLRLAHPKSTDAELNQVLAFATGKEGCTNPLVVAFQKAQTLTTEKKDIKEAITLIKEFKLPWEALPTELLGQKDIWLALLDDMPMTALVRNLGKMTSLGLFGSALDKTTKIAVESLTNKEYVKASKLHPLNVLVAKKTYESGHGFKGKLSWSPNSKIVAALEKAFYLAFDNVEATGKNFYFGIDVSGSMSSAMDGKNLSCCEAAAALAMVTIKKEPFCEVRGFAGGSAGGYGRSTNTVMRDLGIREDDTLTAACKKAQDNNFGSTDASLPILDAINRNLDVDAFVIITDNETYGGSTHVFQALKRYRQRTGKNAKLIVMGMTATECTIADPADPDSLNVVGFDTAIPSIINSFVGM